MRAPNDSGPTAFHRLCPAQLGALRPAVLLKAVALAALVGLSACGNRGRVQNYNMSSNPPPVRDMDTASRLRVAEAAETSGNFAMAATLYAAAAAAEPGRADVQARFASALARAGNPTRAEEVLSAALERHPNDTALNIQLGRLRLRTGAAEQALAIFDRVLARAPNNADALDGRGVALDLLDRPAEAQQSYQAARAVAPNDMRIASNLAFSLLLEGRAGEGRDVLEPFAGRGDLAGRARTTLAIARAMTGDQDGAMALLGSGVTREELDQLVAGLPGSRPGAASRGRAAVGRAGADPAPSDARFRPFDEEPRPRRPARPRSATP